MRLLGRQSQAKRARWPLLAIAALTLAGTLVGCNGSNGEIPASKLQPGSSDADPASGPYQPAAPPPTARAAPIATVRTAPTAAPPPVEETDSETDTPLEEAILVLERPDIPEHLQTLIVGERRRFEAEQNPDSEVNIYVQKITCEDPISISYVKDLMTDTGFRDGGILERGAIQEIGELFYRFSWKNGSIEIGYPTIVPLCEAVDQDPWSHISWYPSLHEKPRLFARISNEDGDWSDVQAFPVPFELPTPSNQLSYNWELPNIMATSTGQHIIFAKQENDNVLIWSTDDLVNWDESIVSLPPPTNLHPVLDIEWSRLEQIVADLDSPIIRVRVAASISLYKLLPEDIAESINWSWSLDCGFEYSNVRQFDLYAFQDGKSGVAVCWYDEVGERQEIFFPWEDLNMNQDTFLYYGSNFGNKPYLQSPNFSGWLWSSKWDSEAGSVSSGGWVELPYIPGKLCCELLRTDAGYLALSIPGWSGYSPIRSGTQVLFFSPDGREWSRLETPEETYARSGQGDWGTPCEESYFFIESIEPYGDKVLVKAENSHDHWNWDWENRGPPPRRSWVVDPDGTNWRILEPHECEESN